MPITETRLITDNAGMPDWAMRTIEALLPILPGEPEDYVGINGRLDATMVRQGTQPLTHSTGAASDLILSLWTGTSPLSKLAGHSGRYNRTVLAKALRVMADELDGGQNA